MTDAYISSLWPFSCYETHMRKSLQLDIRLQQTQALISFNSMLVHHAFAETCHRGLRDLLSILPIITGTMNTAVQSLSTWQSVFSDVVYKCTASRMCLQQRKVYLLTVTPPAACSDNTISSDYFDVFRNTIDTSLQAIADELQSFGQKFASNAPDSRVSQCWVNKTNQFLSITVQELRNGGYWVRHVMKRND